MNKVKEIVIDSSELKNIKLSFKTKTVLKIKHDDICYCFFIYLRKRSKQLLVLSNGAVEPKKKKPPIFMRNSWIEDLPGSLIFIDDPTLHGTNLKLGWGQGTREQYALENIASFIDTLRERLKYERENLYFYGSSAGGFMSIIYAAILKGSSAIVNNPQTNVLKYYDSAVTPLLRHVYGMEDWDSIKKEYGHRLYVLEAFKYYMNIPTIYYFQNKLCSGDMKKQLTPLVSDMKKGEMDMNKIYIHHYFDNEAGHGPLTKEGTVKIINLAFSGNLNYHA